MSLINPQMGETTRQVGPVIAHFDVIKIADDMVQESYDILCSDRHNGNRFYKAWPNKKNFCNRFREMFVQQAVSSLIDRLADPNTPEALKKEIFEVIKLDGAVPGAKRRGVIELEEITPTPKLILP